jgi:GTP-binding protein
MAYLKGRPSLKRVFVLIDSRHGLKPNDHDVFKILNEAAVSFQIILTKVDQISAGALRQTVTAVRQGLAAYPAAHPDILPSSSREGTGIPRIRSLIQQII